MISRISRSARIVLIAPLLGLLVACSGCSSEFVTIQVESNPTSAEVWMNDQHVDTTPCPIHFEGEGDFELRLRKPGYGEVLKRVRVYEEQDEAGTPTLRADPTAMTVTLDPVSPDAGAGAGQGTGGSGSGGSGSSTGYYE
jgi:PEGA domain